MISSANTEPGTMGISGDNSSRPPSNDCLHEKTPPQDGSASSVIISAPIPTVTTSAAPTAAAREEQSSEQKHDPAQDALPPPPPFTVFTKWQRHWISVATSWAAMFSTISSYIYYPALLPISRDLGVSITAANLTVTSYMVVAGLAPSFMGDMSDQSGRRPVYMLMFLLMIGANVGIALQKSYPALLVLRMVQSAGASGLYGAAYGVVADIAAISERGSFVGVLQLTGDIAISFGPVIGGSLTERLGWRWIFWFLIILTGTHFIALLLFLPETQRRIVGNGSAMPRGLLYKSLFTSLVQSKDVRKRENICLDEEAGSEDTRLSQEKKKQRHHFPNPLACLPILAHKGSLAVIVVNAITYSVKMTLQASLGSLAVEIYRLDYIAAGLVYLPSGIMGGAASYLTGKFIDRTYRRKVAELNGREQETAGKTVTRTETTATTATTTTTHDRSSPDFPLERVRLKGSYPLIALSIAGTIGYGVALSQKSHIAVMLVMHTLMGATTGASFTLYGTLLTDLNVQRSATAQAASNLVRCIVAGASIAVTQELIDAVGVGWCFAVYGGFYALEVPLVWALCRYGMGWRKQHNGRGGSCTYPPLAR